MASRTLRHNGWVRPGRAVLAVLVVAVAAIGSAGAPGPDGPAFGVTEFRITYGGVDDAKHALHGGHPDLPKIPELLELGIRLGQVADGFVAARAGVESTTVQLGAAGRAPVKRYYATAIQSISKQILGEFRRRGLVGVFVAPHPEDILERRREDADGKMVVGLEDRRPEGQTFLRIVIWVGVVTEVRTLASGKRIPTSARVNHPSHMRMRLGSPVGPPVEGAEDRSGLLRDRELKRYIYGLSRHPSRRVDLALSSAEQPGGVVLDYLVSEDKPWFAYAQASNTGTRYTRPWRERIGFVHNQFTGRDDTLSLDYVTAGFDETHAVLMSYEAPFFGCPRTRYRVYGSWSKYTASDVGLASSTFQGETWTFGGELLATVLQFERFFVDAVGGLRWEHIEVDDELLDTHGAAGIFVPYVGLRFERLAETASTWGHVILEWTESGISHMPRRELEPLGRAEPARDWEILKFDVNQSIFLEPLMSPAAWKDPGTWSSSTLAHELFLSVRGQHALGHRPIPQHQGVAGGLYTVRGYPESIVAGDSVLVCTMEYRFHVPRIFKPRAPAKVPLLTRPFRVAPQQVYGRPDWDLMFRCFYDVGRVTQEHNATFEADETLRGAGVGVELRVKSYLTVRCDYGVALEGVETPSREVNSGHNRIHTAVTIAF